MIKINWQLLIIFFSRYEPLNQFQPNLAQSIHGWRGFKFVSKGPHPSQNGDDYEIVKIH